MSKYWICGFWTEKLNDYCVATKEEFEKIINDIAMDLWNKEQKEIEVDDMQNFTWYMYNNEIVGYIEK